MILCQFGTKNKKVSKTNPLFTNLIVAIIEKNLILTPSPPQNLMVLMFGTPPPHFYEKRGVGPSENLVIWGVPKILLKRGNNPEKGGLI